MCSAIGMPRRRVEDERLVQGQGRFVGDLRRPDMLYVAFVRSPHAHARIVAVEMERARAMPGVVAALSAADLPALARPLAPPADTPGVQTRLAAPLAHRLVRHVGEAVAVVVAATPYLAADAAEAVEVEYEPLPAVVQPSLPADSPSTLHADPPIASPSILHGNSPLVHDDVPGNLAGRLEIAIGDYAAVRRSAALVLGETFSFARVAGGALEPRGVMAEPGTPNSDDDVIVWTSTQAAHQVRRAIAGALDLPERRVRVVAPDVGGGFGVKARVYPEEAVLAALALALGRPVCWTATRSEDMLTTCQGRDQTVYAELAAGGDGTIAGLSLHVVQDCGAYLASGLVVPQHTAQHALGPYRVPAYAAQVDGFYTNKAPLSPVRGGGRPQGVFIMERMLDRLAQRLGLDPLEVRQRNLLQPADFPYDTGLRHGASAPSVVYDSGDYPAYLERARAAIGYDAFRATQAAERNAGRYRGIAVTLFLESTGAGQETARVAVAPDGSVRVRVGTSSQGQGHATTLAQLCAERLGVPVESVTVRGGDTAFTEHGMPTVASRTALMAGNAVALAARSVRRLLLEAAAELLEASPDDLELSDGVIAVRGAPGRAVTLAELAAQYAAREPARELGAEETYAPARPACFSGGAHAAIIAVDLETGAIALERYVVVHDCGTIINPTIVDGQVHGGVAHGVGNALWEALRYDEAGQLLSASFMDYALPRAVGLPAFEVTHVQTPSPFNAEGIKGAGEGGTIGALATIASAVEDALAPFGIAISELPLRAERLIAAFVEQSG